jgi:hypothetical protein
MHALLGLEGDVMIAKWSAVRRPQLPKFQKKKLTLFSKERFSVSLLTPSLEEQGLPRPV